MSKYLSQQDIMNAAYQPGAGGIGILPVRTVLDSLEASGDWTALNAATTNIATDVNHRGGGSVSIEFDKILDAAITTAGITKTIPDDNKLDLEGVVEGGFITFYFFTPSGAAAANFETLRFTLGTDASHNYIWNIPLAALNGGGWTKIRCDLDAPDTITGNGVDFNDITYLAVSAIFTNAADALADMLVDTIAVESAGSFVIPGELIYSEENDEMQDTNPVIGYIFDVRPYTTVNIMATGITYGTETYLEFTVSEYATLSSAAVPYTEWSSADPKVASQPAWRVTAAAGETAVSISLDVAAVNYLQINADSDADNTGTFDVRIVGSRD